MEPNNDERACDGVSYKSDIIPSISEASRRLVLGQAMDLNCLTWIVSFSMVEQCQLIATSVVVTPLVNSLPTVTVKASARGEESYTFHPWNTWHVLGKPVEVVAHAIGGVYYSNGVPLGDMEERVASPEVLT